MVLRADIAMRLGAVYIRRVAGYCRASFSLAIVVVGLPVGLPKGIHGTFERAETCIRHVTCCCLAAADNWLDTMFSFATLHIGTGVYHISAAVDASEASHSPASIAF
jgi:hypothetical protein